jgi:hypothetical protein
MQGELFHEDASAAAQRKVRSNFSLESAKKRKNDRVSINDMHKWQFVGGSGLLRTRRRRSNQQTQEKTELL